MKMRYYAVIGRIPGDDEDTAIVYQAKDEQSAMMLFTTEMLDGQDETAEDLEKPYGAYIVITNIFVSDTEIVSLGGWH